MTTSREEGGTPDDPADADPETLAGNLYAHSVFLRTLECELAALIKERSEEQQKFLEGEHDCRVEAESKLAEANAAINFLKAERDAQV